MTSTNRRRRGHIYNHVDLTWDGLKLRLTSGRLLATVEPDAQWPKMYRVRLPNRRPTDMVNLSRAKDAATLLACADLNREQATGADSPIESKADPVG